jgi:hypothetical protein
MHRALDESRTERGARRRQQRKSCDWGRFGADVHDGHEQSQVDRVAVGDLLNDPGYLHTHLVVLQPG